MNMKVKIAIAAAIVVALVALIIIDRKTSSGDKTATAAQPQQPALFPQHNSGKMPADYSEKDEKTFEGKKTGGVTTEKTENKDGLKGTGNESKGTETLKQTESGDGGTEEYVIKPGDTFASIAERKYGDSGLWKVIADANPALDPRRLRQGQKIKVPVKPALKTDETAITSDGGKKVYIVQVGDDLGKISKKVYNTTVHWKKIFEANRDRLENPDDLQVGMRLLLPDVLPSKDVAPKTDGKESDLAGKRTHKVQTKDVLWNIAEKYRGERGILEMIDLIVKSNGDKLKTASTPLRIGWVLVIP